MGNIEIGEDRIPKIIFIIAAIVLLLLTNHQGLAQSHQQPAVSGTPCCGSIANSSNRVLAGKSIEKVPPTYPEKAKIQKITGSVVVEVTLDELGNVIRSRALSGPKILRKSATAAALEWKFEPTLLDGRPVKVIGTITFNFNPEEKDSENHKENEYGRSSNH